MTFISGHLHCDPHLGNVFIRPAHRHGQNFEIVLLDHGLYRQLPQQLRVDYAHLWLSIIHNDSTSPPPRPPLPTPDNLIIVPKMRYYSEIVANIPPEKFPLFASAITGRDYGRVIRSVSGQTIPTNIANVKKIDRMDVGGDVMLELVDLLSNMPRIMLLLFKTNDLTRYYYGVSGG